MFPPNYQYEPTALTYPITLKGYLSCYGGPYESLIYNRYDITNDITNRYFKIVSWQPFAHYYGNPPHTTELRATLRYVDSHPKLTLIEFVQTETRPNYWENEPQEVASVVGDLDLGEKGSWHEHGIGTASIEWTRTTEPLENNSYAIIISNTENGGTISITIEEVE